MEFSKADKNLMKAVYVFMTSNDNKLFTDYLKSVSDVVLIDTKPRQDSKIRIIENVEEADVSEVVILNTDLQRLADYEKRFVEIAGYYHFANTGEGVFQLLRSKISGYDQNCLMNGRLAASYRSKETDQWVKEVLK